MLLYYDHGNDKDDGFVWQKLLESGENLLNSLSELRKDDTVFKTQRGFCEEPILNG